MKTCFDCKEWYFSYACYHPDAFPKSGGSKHKNIECEYTTEGSKEPHPFDGIPSWCPLIKGGK